MDEIAQENKYEKEFDIAVKMMKDLWYVRRANVRTMWYGTIEINGTKCGECGLFILYENYTTKFTEMNQLSANIIIDHYSLLAGEDVKEMKKKLSAGQIEYLRKNKK